MASRPPPTCALPPVSVLTHTRRNRTPGSADTAETRLGIGGYTNDRRRYPRDIQLAHCVYACGNPRLPRRRPPSRHLSLRRAPVPPAPATAPTPAPSQRDTPVRRNAAGLALAPHVSDLPAPSAAPSCAGMQAYQHARACACTPAAQRQGTPAQRTRAELSKTRPAHPRGECAPGRQYRRMACGQGARPLFNADV